MKSDFQSSGDANRHYELLWEWTQIFRDIGRNIQRLADDVDPPGRQQLATEVSVKALTAKVDGLLAERNGRQDEAALPKKEWYTVKEAVEFLGHKYMPRTIAQACNEGRIKDVKKLGKNWRIQLSELEQIRNEGRLPVLLK
ncbi:MAG: helix-turn-helix domain-containing protein [Candidatus Nealsonbacteria bacterium]|nr:helix-turn-helix domain-containing protein [Candidatus Nealsonbacteria bacterium]